MTTPQDPSPFILTKPVWFVRFVAIFSLLCFLRTESSPEIHGIRHTPYPLRPRHRARRTRDDLLTRTGRDWEPMSPLGLGWLRLWSSRSWSWTAVLVLLRDWKTWERRRCSSDRTLKSFSHCVWFLCLASDVHVFLLEQFGSSSLEHQPVKASYLRFWSCSVLELLDVPRRSELILLNPNGHSRRWSCCIHDPCALKSGMELFWSTRCFSRTSHSLLIINSTRRVLSCPCFV